MSEIMRRQTAAPPATRRALREVDRQQRIEERQEDAAYEVARRKVANIGRFSNFGSGVMATMNLVTEQAATVVPELSANIYMLNAVCSGGIVNVAGELAQ